MRALLLIALLPLAAPAAAQHDTIALDTSGALLHIQRYHGQPLRDTVVLFNPFDFGAMVANVYMNRAGHRVEVAPVNLLRPGQHAFLVLTGEPWPLVQPYEMDLRLTVFSERDTAFRHVIRVKVKADYNR